MAVSVFQQNDSININIFSSEELLQLPLICNRRGGPVLQKVAPFGKNNVFKKKEYQIKMQYYHNCSTDNMVRKIEKSFTYVPMKKTKGASLFKIQLKDNGYLFDQTFGPFVAKLVYPENVLDWGLGRIVHNDEMGRKTKWTDKHGNLYLKMQWKQLFNL
ncbi:hypothetical protein GCK72_025870 [Caenorhabditis remanei]|uniref:Uncharacterized protein n=1 Tax=Caenorhabditis remanei TaxID=31234 RepID=A0A6A5G3Y2_CAERE|nr:hypothetical protein GCK72_025870 [Caenorhabditis remanei]KAF1749402.1 hypothetical protein GCK72_025870 [Caenorhabditis remanei]